MKIQPIISTRVVAVKNRPGNAIVLSRFSLTSLPQDCAGLLRTAASRAGQVAAFPSHGLFVFSAHKIERSSPAPVPCKTIFTPSLPPPEPPTALPVCSLCRDVLKVAVIEIVGGISRNANPQFNGPDASSGTVCQVMSVRMMPHIGHGEGLAPLAYISLVYQRR